MAAKIVLMATARGAALKPAYCPTRRALGVCARLPACANFVVRLVTMAQRRMFCSPSSLSFFPPSSLPPSSQATLDVVMNLQFHYIEKLWQTFWYATAPSSDGNTAITRSGFPATFFTS